VVQALVVSLGCGSASAFAHHLQVRINRRADGLRFAGELIRHLRSLQQMETDENG
jgi:Asp/Glu/hydantoin racemase